MLPASLSPHKVSKSGKILSDDGSSGKKRKRRKKKSRKKNSPSSHFMSKRNDETSDMSHPVFDPKQGKKLWRSFLRKKERAGVNFDTMSWYRKNVLHPMPKIKVQKKKEEQKKLRPITLKPVTPVSSTPWDSRQGKRKRPLPDNLLSVPTNLGMTGYNELMTGFETFEEKMQMLFTKTVARQVSKDFLLQVLDNDRRRRAADVRRAARDRANEIVVKRCLAKLKKKNMVQAFETWVELHDLVRRMKRLASRVMGGTKTHTMEVWKKFVIDCRKLKKDAAFEYNRKYGRYAVKIQALVRGVLKREFIRRTAAANVIQRMVRAWHAKNIVKRAKAHLEREENKLKKFARIMKHGKIARIFDYWSAYVKKVLRVRRFVIKQVNGLKYTMFINLRTYARKEIADRRLWATKVLQRAYRAWTARRILYRMKKKKAEQMKRLRRFMLHVTHGTLFRIYTAWAGETKRMNRFKFLVGKAKNSTVQRLVNTWRENATFVRRRRELGRKMFLSCEKLCFFAWYEFHMEWQAYKSGEATTIQCWWRCILANKEYEKRYEHKLLLDEQERQRQAYAEKESWRHKEMEIKPGEETERYKDIVEEIRLAQEWGGGLFHSEKVLHDTFDMRRKGHIVMARLKEELIKENAFIVQRRNAEKDWENLSFKLENIRFYKETPQEKLAHEMHDIPQRSVHFPNRTLPGAGDTIIWQGELSTNFEKDVTSTLKEWMFMKKQGWISHSQFLQWISKGFMKNLNSFEKRQVVWKVLKELFEPNLIAEIIVTFQNNDMIKKMDMEPASTYKYCKTGVKLEYSKVYHGNVVVDDDDDEEEEELEQDVVVEEDEIENNADALAIVETDIGEQNGDKDVLVKEDNADPPKTMIGAGEEGEEKAIVDDDEQKED